MQKGSTRRPAARRSKPAAAAKAAAPAAAKPPAAPPELPFGGVWQYDPAPESRSVAPIAARHELFVGGEFVQPRTGRYSATENPATGEVLSEVAAAGPKDVDAAVQAAQAALRGWQRLSGDDRARYLFRIARLLQERAREFAVLETLDNGKPIKESRDIDVPLAAQHFFYHAGWADKLELLFPGARPEPLGVVGQIIPWNFPLLMAAWKIAPALAAGNTVVLKPAETSPLTALRLMEVCQQAGLPPGVVNLVTGDGETGAALVRHPGLAKIAFTGSTEVGKEIQRAVAGRGIDLTLELGGKAAHLVFEDAALDQAVEGVVRGIFMNQGHVCCAGSRLLVQESVHEVFVQKLLRRMARIRVGDPLDKNTDMGAVHSKAQLERIRELCAAGAAEGATMHQPACRLPARGHWWLPTLFTDVHSSHRIAREEIFGPVLSVMSFRTAEEAVEKANHTPYGLSAGIWTEKGARILWVAERLRAGVVWNNTYNRFDPAAPFGGYHESGFGREGGRQGLRSYLRLPGGLSAG